MCIFNLLRIIIQRGTSKGLVRVRIARLQRWHRGLGMLAYHKMCVTSQPHTALSSPLLIPAPFDQYYCLKGINWKHSPLCVCLCVCVIKYFCVALTEHSWPLCFTTWFGDVGNYPCRGRLPVEYQYVCGNHQHGRIHGGPAKLFGPKCQTSVKKAKWKGEIKEKTTQGSFSPSDLCTVLCLSSHAVCPIHICINTTFSRWMKCTWPTAPQETEKDWRLKNMVEIRATASLNDVKLLISSQSKCVICA